MVLNLPSPHAMSGARKVYGLEPAWGQAPCIQLDLALAWPHTLKLHFPSHQQGSPQALKFGGWEAAIHTSFGRSPAAKVFDPMGSPESLMTWLCSLGIEHPWFIPKAAVLWEWQQEANMIKAIECKGKM